MNRLKQTPKDGIWIDEANIQIPYNRTTPYERLKEKKANSLYMDAKSINERMVSYKQSIIEATNEVLDLARQENKVKLDSKGNFTWYNFDRSLKIEVNVNEQIRFDDILIESAREKLIGLIRENIQGDDFIISIVEDAFQTSKGRLDTSKILGLKKHSQRIKTTHIREQWQEAMALIDKSISRPNSKTYHKVWVKDEEGKYQGIELNFSAI